MGKRILALTLVLALALPVPAWGAEETAKTYDQAVAELLGQDGYTVATTLDAPSCAVVLLWKDAEGVTPGTVRDYYLYLLPKDTAEPVRLMLPSTAMAGFFPTQYPTNRAPDSMALNDDGSALTYVYSFERALFNAGGEMLHDAGTYTYTVALPSGELTVSHEKKTTPALGGEGTAFVDVSPEDWFAPYVNVCVEAGLMNGVGGGRFAPNETLTPAQTATLAGRIHHLKNGGDGNLPAAPKDYGLLTVEFEDGTVLNLDSSEYHLYPIPMSAVLGAEVSEEKLEGLDWLGVGDRADVTVTAHLAETVGPLPGVAYWNGYSGRGHLRLSPRNGATEEERAAFSAMTYGISPLRLMRPSAEGWFRNTVYYLETALEIDDARIVIGYKGNPDGAASREDFVVSLHIAAGDLLTPQINHISDYPDAEAVYNKWLTEIVLDFYNAGVLTGKDELGTFDKASPLTRAEAAAICARILRPELRVEFQPAPVPQRFTYSLTYLMDDPMQSHIVTYPVLPLITEDGVSNGILTLDGTLIPFPDDGEKPISMEPQGSCYHMSFWFTEADGTRVEKGGLIDKTGTFVVPLTAGCYRSAPLADGNFLSQSGTSETGVGTLWDREGNATDLGSIDWWKAIEAHGGHASASPWADIDAASYCYIDQIGHRVSEDFDWVGDLTDDGRGFVSKDGKLYCIQFEKV